MVQIFSLSLRWHEMVTVFKRATYIVLLLEGKCAGCVNSWDSLAIVHIGHWMELGDLEFLSFLYLHFSNRWWWYVLVLPSSSLSCWYFAITFIIFVSSVRSSWRHTVPLPLLVCEARKLCEISTALAPNHYKIINANQSNLEQLTQYSF